MKSSKKFVSALLVGVVGIFALASMTLADYEEEDGKIKVKVRTVNEQGRFVRLGNAKTYLLSKNGKTVKKKKKAGDSGNKTYKDLTAGNKYRVACKKDGYVSFKNAEKERYVTSEVKVKSGKTVEKSCKLAVE